MRNSAGHPGADVRRALSNRVKIIIDFDDVLFNTRDFRNDLRDIFLRSDITKQVFEKCYYGAAKINRRNLEKYDADKHIRAIEKHLGTKLPVVRRKIKRLLKNCGCYVFSDAIKFLKHFRNKKIRIYLVSYTNTAFQQEKIACSGLGKYFKKVILTRGLKSEGINRLLRAKKIKRSELIYFLDDRAEQIKDVKKKHPYIKTIFVQRSEGRYRDKINKYCDFRIKNFEEAYPIIKHKD